MMKWQIIAVLGVLAVGTAYILVEGENGAVVAGENETNAKQAKKKELGKPRPKRSPRLMRRADTNKDGMVDNKEFHAMHEKAFKRLDLNKDGSLSVKEVSVNAKKQRAARKARVEKRNKNKKKTN